MTDTKNRSKPNQKYKGHIQPQLMTRLRYLKEFFYYSSVKSFPQTALFSIRNAKTDKLASVR